MSKDEYLQKIKAIQDTMQAMFEEEDKLLGILTSAKEEAHQNVIKYAAGQEV